MDTYPIENFRLLGFSFNVVANLCSSATKVIRQVEGILIWNSALTGS